MVSWFKQLDDLLRGRKTLPQDLAVGRLELPLGKFVIMAVILGMVYGFFMGWYAVLSRAEPCYQQVLASTVKLPALFLLTLAVTFPSLYVFNALMGCRLSFVATLRLLLSAVVVNVTVAASMGTILGFFTLSTTSYAFMILLNVVLLAVAGFVGLAFLLHTLRRLSLSTTAVPRQVWPRPEGTEPAASADDKGSYLSGMVDAKTARNDPDTKAEEKGTNTPGPLDRSFMEIPEQAIIESKMIFRIWVIIYGLVGAQMGWLMRPFIGSPDIPFTWFRERSGNFFLAVHQQIQNLLGLN